jgi:hypothetical protein
VQAKRWTCVLGGGPGCCPPLVYIGRRLCKGAARRRGVARRSGYRYGPLPVPEPAFAPPPPEPGAGSSRAVGRGKGSIHHGTVRGPRAGEIQMGGRAGDWVGAPEERRTAVHGRPQSPARTPGLVDPAVPSACRPSGERVESSSAERPARSRSAGEGCRRDVAAKPEELAGGGGWGELLRRGTRARGRRGRLRQRPGGGGVAVRDEAGTCAGGREGCCPTAGGACAGRLRPVAESLGECTVVGI